MQLFTVIHLRDRFRSPFTQRDIIVLREGVKTVGVSTTSLYDTSVQRGSYFVCIYEADFGMFR